MIPSRPADTDDAATEPIADLPLFSQGEIATAVIDSPPAEPDAATLASAAAEGSAVEQTTLPIEPPHDQQEPVADASPRPAPIGRRFAAAALDALVLAAVLVTLVAGGTLLGAPVSWTALPYYLPTWGLFSLLYHVVPLLFWGRTPGMAYVGVVARTLSGRSLSVGQATRRWAASMVTLGLLGLPGLLALSGRSLADRTSRTSTFV